MADITQAEQCSCNYEPRWQCTCPHAPHELVFGVPLWCIEEDCLCGVEPCPACGHHARYVNDTTTRHWRCQQCGTAWPPVIYY